ncbi:MAG: hypothetical protein EBR02_04105 [Alphaproteobacteria bacterium]|nr:hypothetical protein [Alphaproteobacteria bacterium]
MSFSEKQDPRSSFDKLAAKLKAEMPKVDAALAKATKPLVEAYLKDGLPKLKTEQQPNEHAAEIKASMQKAYDILEAYRKTLPFAERETFYADKVKEVAAQSDNLGELSEYSFATNPAATLLYLLMQKGNPAASWIENVDTAIDIVTPQRVIGISERDRFD